MSPHAGSLVKLDADGARSESQAASSPAAPRAYEFEHDAPRFPSRSRTIHGAWPPRAHARGLAARAAGTARDDFGPAHPRTSGGALRRGAHAGAQAREPAAAGGSHAGCAARARPAAAVGGARTAAEVVRRVPALHRAA